MKALLHIFPPKVVGKVIGLIRLLAWEPYILRDVHQNPGSWQDGTRFISFFLFLWKVHFFGNNKTYASRISSKDQTKIKKYQNTSSKVITVSWEGFWKLCKASVWVVQREGQLILLIHAADRRVALAQFTGKGGCLPRVWKTSAYCRYHPNRVGQFWDVWCRHDMVTPGGRHTHRYHTRGKFDVAWVSFWAKLWPWCVFLKDLGWLKIVIPKVSQNWLDSQDIPGLMSLSFSGARWILVLISMLYRHVKII